MSEINQCQTCYKKFPRPQQLHLCQNCLAYYCNDCIKNKHIKKNQDPIVLCKICWKIRFICDAIG